MATSDTTGEDSTTGPGVESDDEQGERRETKGERTRRRLLEIAIERFGERGYRATSVSEIARAAGLTQAAVYAYFPNKEALFDAAVDADASTVIEAASLRAQGTPGRQLVPLLLLFILGSLEDHPLLHRVVSGKEPDAVHRLINLPALGRLTEAIATELRAGQERGEVRGDIDPEIMAAGSESILLSFVMSVSQVGSTTEARRQIGVVTIFDAAFRPVDLPTTATA